MATIENKTYVRDQPTPPAVSQFDAEPLVVTPIVTDEPVSNLVENDMSLVVATGDTTLRPLRDYLANFTPGGASSFTSRTTAAAATIPVTVAAVETTGYATAGDGGGALYYRAGGSTPGGFQSGDGAWWALEKGNINVRQYGAVGNGTGDDTAAVRLAAQALVTTVTAGPSYSTAIARMVFPPGVYKLTGSINLQNLAQTVAGGSWVVDMSGATIYCAALGKTIFDCLGSRWGKFIGGLLIGDVTATPAIGIQYGRMATVGPTGFGDGFIFEQTSFTGYWSRAAFYSIQGETDLFDGVFIYNQHATGGVCVYLDGLNHLGSISDFSNSTLPADTVFSNIQHTFIGTDFRVPSGGAPAVDLLDADQTHFINGYAVSTGSCIRHTAVGAAGATARDLWHDVHCELNQVNVEFRQLGASAAFVVEGLYLNDINSQASVALIQAGANVSKLYIYDGDIRPADETSALFSGSIQYGGMIRGNPASWLMLLNADASLSTSAGLLGSRGALNTVALSQVLTAARTWTLPAANSVAAGWELSIVDYVGGISAANSLTIARAGADTIIGGISIVLSAPYESVILISDGVSRWTPVGGSLSGSFRAAPVTAIPAGGTIGVGYKFSSTANFGVFFGSGAPTLSAAKGSLYLRSDGTTTNDRAYINTNGSTTWTALTTAA